MVETRTAEGKKLMEMIGQLAAAVNQPAELLEFQKRLNAQIIRDQEEEIRGLKVAIEKITGDRDALQATVAQKDGAIEFLRAELETKRAEIRAQQNTIDDQLHFKTDYERLSHDVETTVVKLDSGRYATLLDVLEQNLYSHELCDFPTCGERDCITEHEED